MVIVLGIVVAVVAVLALREPSGHNRALPTASTTAPLSKNPAPTSPASSASGARSSTSTSTTPTTSASPVDRSLQIAVLNDTTTSGLAKLAAQRFVDGGWTVTRFGNLPSDITDIISTCAYYDPSVAGAKSAAEALQKQFPTIKRIKEKFDGLGSEPVVIVLADDYSS